MFLMKNDDISVHLKDGEVFFVFRDPDITMDSFLDRLPSGTDYRIACFGGYDNAVVLTIAEEVMV